VIGSEELAGRDIKHVVRQRINALTDERSPKVVRSTALIIKSSKTPASANGRPRSSARDEHDGKTRVEVSEHDRAEIERAGSAMLKTAANGCANLSALSGLFGNGYDRSKRQETTGKRQDQSGRR